MNMVRRLFKRLFTPITIMLVPHSNSKHFSFKLPSIGIIISVLLWLTGSVYVLVTAVNSIEYTKMEERLNYYSSQFVELKTTMNALKKADNDFRKIFSLGSKEKVLENMQPTDSGSIDIEALRVQIKSTIENVKDIREYLSNQRDLYMATPRGLPVDGRLSSNYGKRENPMHGGIDFHSGIDIAVPPGAPIRATADGIVSFSGWSGGSGNLIVIEHGFGFSTLYAHNRKNLAQVGQFVKRGDVISHAGSTGNATGPHSHYEIWKDGRHINPHKFMEGRS